VLSRISAAAVQFRKDPLQGTFPAHSNTGSASEQRTALRPDFTAAAGPSAARVSLFAVGQ